MARFDWNWISAQDQMIARSYIGELRAPDYHFLPGNDPYQFRWYVAPRKYDPRFPAAFLHVMIRDDPTDELHDHNWENTSHVLAGNMCEKYGREGNLHGIRHLHPGVIVHRAADDTHALFLDDCRYAMTFFVVGPKVMENHYWRITNGLA